MVSRTAQTVTIVDTEMVAGASVSGLVKLGAVPIGGWPAGMAHRSTLVGNEAMAFNGGKKKKVLGRAMVSI